MKGAAPPGAGTVAPRASPECLRSGPHRRTESSAQGGIPGAPRPNSAAHSRRQGSKAAGVVASSVESGGPRGMAGGDGRELRVRRRCAEQEG